MNLAYGYELGTTRYTDIAISTTTRLRSCYYIGSSGSGKSSALATSIHQDVRDGTGFIVFDVEERLTDLTLRYLKDAGRQCVVIDPTNTEYVTPLNVLSDDGSHPHTIIENVLGALRRAWPDAWGARSEDLFRHSLILLREHGLTMGELARLLSDREFRTRLALASRDHRCRLFFLNHLEGLSQREARTWLEAPRNKAAALASNPFVCAPLSTTTCLDFLKLMDQGKAIVVNLSERVLGDSSKLLGMLIVSRLYQASLRRAEGARPFYIYADEYQNLATRAFLDLCTRSRKRGIGSVVAHQSTLQPPFDQNPEYVSTMLANTAVHVCMAMGREDAERFAKEIFPATGTQPKKGSKHWLWGEYTEKTAPNYSVQEEREHQAAMLEHQKQREMFIKVKAKEGTTVYAAEAYELPEPEASSKQAQQLARKSAKRFGVPATSVAEATEARLKPFEPRKRKRHEDDGDPS